MNKITEYLIEKVKNNPRFLPIAHFIQSKVNNNLGLFRRFDQKVRIYLTFRCNLKCDYCVNESLPSQDKKNSYNLLSGREWVDIINKLGRDVILTGGEPFLYPDINYIIQRINPGLKVTVYTNFLWDVGKFLGEVNRPVSFYGSYHSGFTPLDRFLDNINMLRDTGRFNGVIHAVNSREHKAELKEALNVFKANGWPVGLDDDQYKLFNSSSQRFRKKVRCRRKIILIAPDGKRYPCVSRMVRRTGELEDFKKGLLKGVWADVCCNDYGYCAPCDGLGVNKIRVIGQ